MNLPFSGSRLANAQIIISEFLNAGLPLSLALAAVVNANAESGLNASAAGDAGQSVGLFQINALKGARTFTGDRKDPHYNTQWIIQEFKSNIDRTSTKGSGSTFTGQSLRSALSRDASVAELTGLWAAYIERPADPVGEASRRTSSARKLFPGLADLPGSAVNSAGAVGQAVVNTTENAVGQVEKAISWKWLAPFIIVGVGFFLIAVTGARRATQPIYVSNPRRKRRARS